MALRIRRGTEAQRTAPPYFESGEIVWTTDYNQLWVGDGTTQGGIPVVGSNVTGHGLTYNGTTHKLEVSGLTTDDIAAGSSINRQYFSTEAAQEAAWALLRDGTHTGITFQYLDGEDKINATVALDGVGIMSVQDDTAPTLGGSLDLNGFDIDGVGNLNITGDVTVTGILDNGSIAIDSDMFTSVSNNFTFGTGSTGTSLNIVSNDNVASTLILTGITSGPQSANSMLYKTARGTNASPAAVQLADATGITQFWSYDGGQYQLTSLIGAFVDPNGTVGPSTTTGMLGLATFSDTNPNNAKAVFINRKGWVTVGRTILDDAKAHMDINGVMLLAPQTSEPTDKYVGMICVADNSNWDPAAVVGSGAYPVFWNGSTWLKMFS